jgi:predicted PurR-regulated permease PerM
MPVELPTTRSVLRTVLAVVAVALILYLIYLLRTPIGWLVIAAFVAIATGGPVAYFSRWMKRGFAIALVYV